MRSSGTKKRLFIIISLFLIAAFSFLAVFLFTDLFRSDTAPEESKGGSEANKSTSQEILMHPAEWACSENAPYAIVKLNGMTDETVILSHHSSLTGIEFRRFLCEVLYFNIPIAHADKYSPDAFDKFRNTTEIYFPESSVEAFSGDETILFYADVKNRDSKKYYTSLLGAENAPVFFPFIDGGIFIPDDMKNTFTYMMIKFFNMAIQSEKDRLASGGESIIYFPEVPLENGMTIEQVCDYFEGMKRASRETWAYMEEHYPNVPW